MFNKLVKSSLIIILMVYAGLLGFSLSSQYVEMKPLPSELVDYVNDFHELTGVEPHYPVGYGTITFSEGAVGVCFNLPGSKYVMFSSKYMPQLSEIQRKLVVYHELAHCSFNAPHVEGSFKDGCPKSVMNPTAITEACAIRHYVDYMIEVRKMAKRGK